MTGVVPPFRQVVVRSVVLGQRHMVRLSRHTGNWRGWRQHGRVNGRISGAGRERQNQEEDTEPPHLATHCGDRGPAPDLRTKRGAHQFQSPSSRMVAGTSSARTMVASTATATATPSPSALISTMSAVTNDRLTQTTISAALVMILPLRCRPSATDRALSPLVAYASWMRLSRNTS